MKLTRSFSLIALTSVVFFVSCATAPGYDPSIPPVTIAKAESGELTRYGQSFESNPYLEPKTLLRGKLNEFFIAKLSFNLQRESRISIIAEAIGPDGTVAAAIYDQDGFRDYWTFVSGSGAEGKYFNKKMNTIAQTCVSSMEFIREAGQSSVFLPMVGKNPIPRPANIYVKISTGSGEPSIFKYTLE